MSDSARRRAPRRRTRCWPADRRRNCPAAGAPSAVRALQAHAARFAVNHEIVARQRTERLVDPALDCAQAPQPRREIPGLVMMQRSPYRDSRQRVSLSLVKRNASSIPAADCTLTASAAIPVGSLRAEKSVALGRVPRRSGAAHPCAATLVRIAAGSEVAHAMPDDS